MLGILFYYLRQPIKDFIRNRHTTLLSDLKTARTKLHEAQEKYEEFSSKLKAVDAEIAAIWDASRKDTEQTKTRVANEAHRLALTISADAKTASLGLVDEFKAFIRADLGRRVLRRAEALIRNQLTTQDRAKIGQEFIQQIESQR